MLNVHKPFHLLIETLPPIINIKIIAANGYTNGRATHPRITINCDMGEEYGSWKMVTRKSHTPL